MLINTRKPSPVASLAISVVAVLGMGTSGLAAQMDVLELDTAEAVSHVHVPSGVMSEISTSTLAQSEDMSVTQTDVAATDDFSFPISVGVAYSLYSDYIFRFVNFSEFDGEGREKPNHQLGVDFGVSLGDYGALAYGAWFEWYAAQHEINGEGANIQEIDHWFEWSYSIEPIATDLAIGMTFYTFPNDKGINTLEYYISLAHNDAWMWKWLFPENEDGVLNPSFFLAHDVDELGGVWIELAVSHDFELFENFTLTPGAMVAIDGDYYVDDTTRFAGSQLSLVAAYDIGSALQLPDWAGDLSISGELYFNDTWGNFEDDGTGQDEFWGGMSLAWAWGG